MHRRRVTLKTEGAKHKIGKWAKICNTQFQVVALVKSVIEI
jgi:hypothetical protein